MTTTTGEVSAPRSRGRDAIIAGAIGLVSGLIVGVIGTVVAIGWALFQAADSQKSVSVPMLIDINVVNDSIRAESGNGLIIPMLLAAVLGAAIGLAIWALRQRSA